MPKAGLLNNVQKPAWGEMFARGPGGYLPESGSLVQRDLVGALVKSGMAGAGESGSPLLAFLAPFAGGAATARTEDVYLDAQQDRDQSAIDKLLGSMADPEPSVLPGSLNPAYGAMAARGGPTRSAAAVANGDRDLLAKTLMAEAGGEGAMGMLAAGSVIANRARAGGYGDGLSGVIMKPGQFSAWNKVTGYAGGEGGLDMSSMTPNAEAYQVADAILSGQYQDPTGGATHYYNPSVANPDWGQQRAGGNWTRIGNHVFGSADGEGRTPARDAAARVAQGDFSTFSDFGPQPMSKDSLGTLMGLMVDPELSDPLRSLASSMVTDGMGDRDGLSPTDQISMASSMLGLEQALIPPQSEPEKGFRPASPEEAARYGAQAGQIGPDGRFYPSNTGADSSNDAGVLRQRNEATELVEGAMTSLMNEGMSREEALASVARDPIYGPQLQILGIDSAQVVKEATAAEQRRAAEAAAAEAERSSRGFFGRVFGGPGKPTPATPAAPTQTPDEADPLGIRG